MKLTTEFTLRIECFFWLSTTGKNKNLPFDRVTSKLCVFLSVFFDFLFGT